MFCESDNTIPLSNVFETPTLIVLDTLVLPSSAICSFDVPYSVKSVALALTARAATPTDVNKILRMRILPLLINLRVMCNIALLTIKIYTKKGKVTTAY